MSSYCWLSTTQNPNKGKAIIRIKHKICSRQWGFELANVNFYRFCWRGTSEIFGMSWTRVCIEFNFLRIQIIESQLCLWIYKILSSILNKNYSSLDSKLWFLNVGVRGIREKWNLRPWTPAGEWDPGRLQLGPWDTGTKNIYVGLGSWDP